MAKPSGNARASSLPTRGNSTVAVRSGGAAAQHTLRNIGLIIGREYSTR